MPAEKKEPEPSGSPDSIDEPQGARVIQAPELPKEQPATPVVDEDDSGISSTPRTTSDAAPNDPTSPVWMTASDLAVGRKQPEDSDSLPPADTVSVQEDAGGPDTPHEGALRSARRDRENGPESASSLTPERLLAGTERPPAGGWRRWLYDASFGRINVGDSDKVRIARALENRVGYRMGERTRYVPMLSRKGGVGKTTVTTLLGMVLADIREDRIIALDANPDRGTLSDRSPGRAEFTARQLVQNRFLVDSFSQLSSYVGRDGSRLDVLASDTDPTVAEAFDDSDYRAVTDILGRYYSIVLTDSGTGMVHSVMNGTLDKADFVVLVSGGSVDEARLASETLSWLEAHGRTDLVSSAIVVINMSAGSPTKVNVDEIEDHFRSRVGTVVRLPYDPHLAEGSRVDLAKLRPATRMAATELAALVVDGLRA